MCDSQFMYKYIPMKGNYYDMDYALTVAKMIVRFEDSDRTKEYYLRIHAKDVFYGMEPCFHFYTIYDKTDVVVSLTRPVVLFTDYNNYNHDLDYYVLNFVSTIKGNESNIDDSTIPAEILSRSYSIWDRLIYTWQSINNLSKGYIPLVRWPIPNYGRYLYNNDLRAKEYPFSFPTDFDTDYRLAIFRSDFGITEPCFHIYKINSEDYKYTRNDICISLVRPIYLYADYILDNNQINYLVTILESKQNYFGKKRTVWEELVRIWYTHSIDAMQKQCNLDIDNDTVNKISDHKLKMPDYIGELLR